MSIFEWFLLQCGGKVTFGSGLTSWRAQAILLLATGLALATGDNMNFAQAASRPPKQGSQQGFDAVTSHLLGTSDEATILSVLKNPFSLDLVSGVPFESQSCGNYSSLKLYGATMGSTSTAGDEVNQIVVDYEEHMTNWKAQQQDEELQRAGKKKLTLATFQWNSLELKPGAPELLAPFLGGDSFPLPDEAMGQRVHGFADGWKSGAIDKIDMMVFTLQENLPYTDSEADLLLGSLGVSLNALSTEKDWTFGYLAQLDNLRGTQHNLDALTAPTSQAIVLVARDRARPSSVCKLQVSMQFGEKGAVGLAVEVDGFGRMGFVGMHVSGWAVDQLQAVLAAVAGTSACGLDASKGLDQYTGGVYLLGDWNEHLDPKALQKLYPIFAKDEQLSNLVADIGENPSESEQARAMRKAMVEMFAQGYVTKNPGIASTYLYTADRLGRRGQSASRDTVAVLKESKFLAVSECYLGGFTYKYKRGCTPQSMAPDAHNFSKWGSCLLRTNWMMPRSLGYLDRLAVRMPTSLGDDGAAGGYAVIGGGRVFYSTLSDHIPMVWYVRVYSGEDDVATRD